MRINLKGTVMPENKLLAKLKNILLFASIATSLFCFGFSSMAKRISNGNGISIIIKSDYEIFERFGSEFIVCIFLFNVLYCVIGIILFLTRLSKYENKFSKKYLLLIPSIIISMVLVFFMTITIPLIQSPGMIIQTLLFAIGSPLFLSYYINQNCKLIFMILLCLFFPINILVSCLDIWGLMWPCCQ
jgi:amino acid transporter